MMNELVKKSSKIFFGSAIAGAGFSLGRDAYKFIKKRFAIILALIILLGSIILPFFSSSKSFRWYNKSKLEYTLTVFLPWHLLGFLAATASYYIFPFFNDFLAQQQLIKEPFPADIVLYFSIASPSVIYLLGVFDALRRRTLRINVHEIELYNTRFMEEVGLAEIDGAKSYTHEDREGNMLRVESVGKDVIEFFAVGRRNKRAYIDIDNEGRFSGYSGIV